MIQRSATPLRCPYCHDDLEGVRPIPCPGCAAAYHVECLQESARSCATLGCEVRPPIRWPRPFDTSVLWTSTPLIGLLLILTSLWAVTDGFVASAFGAFASMAMVLLLLWAVLVLTMQALGLVGRQ